MLPTSPISAGAEAANSNWRRGEMAGVVGGTGNAASDWAAPAWPSSNSVQYL